MKLFEIEEEIEKCYDPDTGEFDEEKFNFLDKLKSDKLEDLICYYKNTMADAEALKVQEKIFKERREREERKAESLKQFITRALDGSKFKTDLVEVGYRKSKSVVVMPEFVEWAEKNGRTELLKYKAPEPDKTAIKNALALEEVIPAQMVENINIQIK